MKSMIGLYCGQTVLVDGIEREIEMLDMEAYDGKGSIRFKDSMWGHHDEVFCDVNIELLPQDHLDSRFCKWHKIMAPEIDEDYEASCCNELIAHKDGDYCPKCGGKIT